MNELQKGIKPDFIVIGSARCGEEIFSEYIKNHPEISTYLVEEGKDISSENLKPLKISSENSKVGIILSNHLVEPYATKQLVELMSISLSVRREQNVKFIIFLRNPAQRAFSLWKFMVCEGYEWIYDFEMALSKESERFYSTYFHTRARGYFWNYMYWRSGLYYKQINHYIEIFGAKWIEMTKFYATEELISKHQKVLKDICDFIGVKYIDLPVKNFRERKFPVLPHAQIVLSRINEYLDKFGNKNTKKDNVKNKFTSLLQNIISGLMKINEILGDDKNHWGWLIEFLKEAYKEEIEKLTEITKINFIKMWNIVKD